MTLTEQAIYLRDTIKPAIKTAIINKGGTVYNSDSFLSYANKIENLPSGSTDLPKLNYNLYRNPNTALLVSKGRIVSGFNTVDKVLLPNDTSDSHLDVDWSNSFEIGVTFKFPTLPNNQQFIYGSTVSNKIYYAPGLAYYGSTSQLEMFISYNGSSSVYDELISFAIEADKWYMVRLKFDASTMVIKYEITDDFETYTTLKEATLTQTMYHNSSALAFGGLAYQAVYSAPNLYIDLFNTYIKDDTGNIAWGAYISELPS